jgi:hypothetical protein
MQAEEDLLAGLFAIENGAGEVVKIEAIQEKSHEFAANHHGMMSGSNCLFIVEPASDSEIAEAQKRVKEAVIALAKKDLAFPDSSTKNLAVTCTKEEAIAKKAKGLYEEWEVASRALKKLENTEFGQTALSYLDEIISQRRRVFNPKRPKKFNGNAATRWGNNQEEESIKRFEAMQAFEGLTGLKLEKTDDKQEFIHLRYVESVDFDFSMWFGCTPDSATLTVINQSLCGNYEETALIPREFKNPSSGVVFDRYRELKTPADLKKENALYYWQVIAQMLCLDAPYAQWIAYDCDVINEAERFVIIDFERDLAVEQVLIDSLFKAVKYIQKRI